MPIRDSHIASIAARRGGWTLERPALPTKVIDEVIGILGKLLLPDKRTQFSAILPLIFKQTVDIEIARARAAVETVKEEAPNGKRSPSGLPARLRIRLHDLKERYHQLLAKGASLEEASALLNRLFADRELFWIVNLAVTETSGLHLALFRKVDQQLTLFMALGPALDMSGAQITAAVRPGTADPAYEQMTRGLAALYLDCTARHPGRSSDGMIERGHEQGVFLILCRLMAREVNAALPVEFQRLPPPDMVKAVRRMVKELKKSFR